MATKAQGESLDWGFHFVNGESKRFPFLEAVDKSHTVDQKCIGFVRSFAFVHQSWDLSNCK